MHHNKTTTDGKHQFLTEPIIIKDAIIIIIILTTHEKQLGFDAG